MALPEFWLGLNRKDLAEKALVSKRDQQALLVQRCESAAKYHRELNLLSTQYKNLEDNPSKKIPKVNRESRRDEEQQAKQKEFLQRRQQQLMVLLAKENEIHLKELKTLSNGEKESDPWSVVKLKEQIEELKLRRLQHEELLKKSNFHKMLYETKIPYLKEFEEKLSDNDLFQSMQHKKQEFEKKASEKLSFETQRKEELKNALMKSQEDVKAVKIERLRLISKWESEMKELIHELDDSKPKLEKLDLQASAYQSYSNSVKDIRRKREDIYKIQQERMKKIIMFRPSREKVLRMAGEVKMRWDMDLKSLEFLWESTKKLEDLISVNSDALTAAIESIASKISQQAKENSDLHVLFEEEISKLWNEKKKLWDDELELHEKLIKNLLESLVREAQENESNCFEEKQQLYRLRTELLNRLAECKEKSKVEDDNMVEKEEYFISKAQDLEDALKKLEARPVTADDTSKSRTKWKPFM